MLCVLRCVLPGSMRHMSRIVSSKSNHKASACVTEHVTNLLFSEVSVFISFNASMGRLKYKNSYRIEFRTNTTLAWAT